MAFIRTFVAVDVSSKIRNAAGKMIQKLAVDAVDYNWVEPENLHITLNFLGDVPDTEVPQVCQRVSAAIQEFGSFELNVMGLGCFPQPEKPRVVWVGVQQGGEELAALNEKIAFALEAMRFPRDRTDYRPHLTLGRLRRGGRWNPSITDAVQRFASFDAGRTVVQEAVVYSSFLDRGGPSYTAMSRIELI